MEQVQTVFFYQGVATSTVAIPPGVIDSNDPRLTASFEKQCVLYFKNACSIFPGYKGSPHMDQVHRVEDAVNPARSADFMNYLRGVPGATDHYFGFIMGSPPPGTIQNLTCQPLGNAPDSVLQNGSAPHANYVLPLPDEVATPLRGYAAIRDTRGVITPPTPLTTGGGYSLSLGDEFDRNFDELVRLGLVAADEHAGAITLTATGVAALGWLARQGVLSSVWSSIISATGSQALGAAATVLWPVAVAILGGGSTFAYDEIYDEPWRFKDLSADQQSAILNNWDLEKVRERVVEFNEQARVLIAHERARSIQVSVANGVLSGRDPIRIDVPGYIAGIRATLYFDKSHSMDLSIARPANGVIELAPPTEKGIYYLHVRDTAEGAEARNVLTIRFARID